MTPKRELLPFIIAFLEKGGCFVLLLVYFERLE